MNTCYRYSAGIAYGIAFLSSPANGVEIHVESEQIADMRRILGRYELPDDLYLAMMADIDAMEDRIHAADNDPDFKNRRIAEIDRSISALGPARYTAQELWLMLVFGAVAVGSLVLAAVRWGI